MKVSNARPLRTPTPGAKALFIGCVLSGTLLVSCSERDSVTKEPEPGTDTGTLELSIELRPSQIVQGRPGNTGDSGGAGGSAGVDGGAGAGGSAGVDGSVIGTSFGSGENPA